MAIRVGIDVWVAAEIDVELGDAPAQRPVHIESPATTEPEVHDIHSLDGLTGSIPVSVDTAAALLRFPRLTRRIGIEPLAALVSVTRLVGMHVPGESSLLSSVDLTDPRAAGRGAGRARVRRHLRRRALLAGGARGLVTGAVRHGVGLSSDRCRSPSNSPATDRCPTSSAGQRWLVVGGSRGLGEAAVLLLAAGGADVRFTYHQGAADADDLVTRVTARIRLPARCPRPGREALGAMLADGWRPTHVAYMATPPIFDGIARRVLRVALRPAARGLRGPLPRTARSAGCRSVERRAVALDGRRRERCSRARRVRRRQACRRGGLRGLAAEHPPLHVATPRFPRLLTDQTTSFVPVEFGDTSSRAARRAARRRRLTRNVGPHRLPPPRPTLRRQTP